METAIAIDSLEVIRGGTTVLPGISATIDRGRVVGLMGPSGCGKSTLMRAIVGVQKVASGSVSVLGQAAGAAALRARVGYMTQASSVYTDLTVKENLTYFARIVGVSSERVGEVIEQVDLAAFGDRVAGRLSGGQRSRVSLAAALLNSPEVLILDEPTVGLDPILRESLWRLFHSLADNGATLLVSSHVMDEAARCDHLLLMREGRIIATPTPQELLEETGSTEMETAFLRLIQSEGSEQG
jgi:ABC-2 type transport system ATP-binding protein